MVRLPIALYAINMSDGNSQHFLTILAESAALQTCVGDCQKCERMLICSSLWLTVTAASVLVESGGDSTLLNCFPAVLGITNLLIHARVGLGWSKELQLNSSKIRVQKETVWLELILKIIFSRCTDCGSSDQDCHLLVLHAQNDSHIKLNKHVISSDPDNFQMICLLT